MTADPRFFAAILRAPSPELGAGERTHLDRAPIDMRLAERQHEAYASSLRAAGLSVTVLPALPGRGDACFVEDTALILPELSILTRPGAASRADEPDQIAPHLPPDRPVVPLPRGRLDGGDVLWIGRTLFVGVSSRTDGEGARALAEVTAPFGYRVNTIPIAHALHLKTAMTHAGGETVLINRLWVPSPPLGMRTLEVDPAEPFGANLLLANDHRFVQWSAPVTAARLAAQGLHADFLDISEFAKAEAGLTCLSLLVPERA